MDGKTLYEKLSAIQASLEAPKGQLNKFGNYKYRSCEDILTALKTHLYQHELTLILSDELVPIGDRYYVKATANLSDDEHNAIYATAYAREEETKKGMDAAQITGAASSYARKYALNGLFCIDDTKDPDTKDNTATAPPKANDPPHPPPGDFITEAQQKELIQMVKIANWSESDLMCLLDVEFQCTSRAEIKVADLPAIWSQIQGKKQ